MKTEGDENFKLQTSSQTKKEAHVESQENEKVQCGWWMKFGTSAAVINVQRFVNKHSLQIICSTLTLFVGLICLSSIRMTDYTDTHLNSFILAEQPVRTKRDEWDKWRYERLDISWTATHHRILSLRSNVSSLWVSACNLHFRSSHARASFDCVTWSCLLSMNRKFGCMRSIEWQCCCIHFLLGWTTCIPTLTHSFVGRNLHGPYYEGCFY